MGENNKEEQNELHKIDLSNNDGYDKRTKIVRELYTSEQIYVQNLTTMIEVTPSLLLLLFSISL